MKNREDHIKKLHEAFRLAINAEPTPALLRLRKTLIQEEVAELFSDIDQAVLLLEKGEVVPETLYINMLKEMADIQTVLSGTSVALKPLRNLEEAFLRVQESNMSKLDADGNPIYREDGKFMKGPHYTAPDLSDLI